MVLAPFHAGTRGDRIGNGPLRLLQKGLVDALRDDGADVGLVEIGPVDPRDGEIGRSFEVMRQVAVAVADARRRKRFPLVLAGNCNASVGTYAGLGDPGIGVVWFDAHPDFNTPDEATGGYFDGMGVAILAGRCWHRLAASVPGFRPLPLDRLLYCGLRDFEPGQREQVERHGIRAILGGTTPVDFAWELDRALAGMPGRALMHLDLDCLDTAVGRANDYAAPGGLGTGDLQNCLLRLGMQIVPAGMTIASFDPDQPGSNAIADAAIAAARAVVTAAGRACSGRTHLGAGPVRRQPG